MSKESRASSASGDGGSSAASLTTVASLTAPSSSRSATATNSSSKEVFESYAKYFGIALAAIVVVGIVFFLMRSSVHTLVDPTFLHNTVNQAQEWNLVSEKASKPVEKLVASTRALAFLNAARVSIKDDEIENMLRVDISKLVKRLEKKQVTAIVEFDQTAAHFASVSVIR